MTAQEAKEKTRLMSEFKITPQYEKIIKDINECISNGKYVLYFYGNFGDNIESKLRLDGYKVQWEVDRNESYYTIRWD